MSFVSPLRLRKSQVAVTHLSRSHVCFPPTPPQLSVDLDTEGDEACCSNRELQQSLQAHTMPVQLDSDSDSEPVKPSPSPGPLEAPAPPAWHQLSGEPRTRTLETAARDILQRSQPPTKADVVQLFHMMPPHLVRNTASGVHMIGGALTSPLYAMYLLYARTAVVHSSNQQVSCKPAFESCLHHLCDSSWLPQ